MWVSKLQSEIVLYNFHAEYVVLSQSMRDLVPMKTLAGEDPKRLEFTMHSTGFDDNAGVVQVTQNHNLCLMTPGFKHIVARYH